MPAGRECLGAQRDRRWSTHQKGLYQVSLVLSTVTSYPRCAWSILMSPYTTIIHFNELERRSRLPFRRDSTNVGRSVHRRILEALSTMRCRLRCLYASDS